MINQEGQPLTNNMTEPSALSEQTELSQQLAEMKNEIAQYRAEVQTLRQQLQIADARTQNGQAVVAATSRRTALRRLAGGAAAGIGALSLMTTVQQSAMAFSGTDVGVDSTAGPDGVGGKFTGGSNLLSQIQLVPGPNAGKPTANTHVAGEIYMDSKGILFTCIADGTPGTWVKPGLNTLATSFRPISQSVTGAAGNSTLYANLNVLGAGIVPTGASAIYAAVQIIPASGIPRLYIYPSDGTDSTNFSNYVGATMGGLNTYYQIVPISAAGTVNVRTYFTGSLFVDVYGFVF